LGKEIIYVGDHLIGDVASATAVGWHSVAVVEELIGGSGETEHTTSIDDGDATQRERRERKGEEERSLRGAPPPGSLATISERWGGFFELSKALLGK
tara:strand:- start:173 stop:463 length:291 start_codon:yes stop_codon:yes gene_type:complete